MSKSTPPTHSYYSTVIVYYLLNLVTDRQTLSRIVLLSQLKMVYLVLLQECVVMTPEMVFLSLHARDDQFYDMTVTAALTIGSTPAPSKALITLPVLDKLWHKGVRGWRVSGECLESVWKVSGRFWKVSGWFLEGVWQVSGG